MEKANEKEGPSSIQEKVKDPFWLEEEVLHILSLLSERWSGRVQQGGDDGESERKTKI